MSNTVFLLSFTKPSQVCFLLCFASCNASVHICNPLGSFVLCPVEHGSCPVACCISSNMSWSGLLSHSHVTLYGLQYLAVRVASVYIFPHALFALSSCFVYSCSVFVLCSFFNHCALLYLALSYSTSWSLHWLLFCSRLVSLSFSPHPTPIVCL